MKSVVLLVALALLLVSLPMTVTGQEPEQQIEQQPEQEYPTSAPSSMSFSSYHGMLKAEISLVPSNASLQPGEKVNFSVRITSLKILGVEMVRFWGLGFGWDARVFLNNMVKFDAEYSSTDPRVLRISGSEGTAMGGGDCTVTASFTLSDGIGARLFKSAFSIEKDQVFSLGTEVRVSGESATGGIITAIEELKASGMYGEYVTVLLKLVDGGNNPIGDSELTFTAGYTSVSLRTAPDGTAEVKIDTGSAMPGDYPYSVSFAGNEFYADCSLNSTYTVERIPTEIAVTTDWSSGVLSINATLSPPIEDNLSFYYYNSDVGGWVFLASGRTGSDGNATVMTEFDKAVGEYWVEAEFRGDSTHAPSQLVFAVRITPPVTVPGYPAPVFPSVTFSLFRGIITADVSIVPSAVSLQPGDKVNFSVKITSFKIFGHELARMWCMFYGFGWDWRVFLNFLVRFDAEYSSTDPKVISLKGSEGTAMGGGDCTVTASFTVSDVMAGRLFRRVFDIGSGQVFTVGTELHVVGEKFAGPTATAIKEIRASGVYKGNVTILLKLVDGGNNPLGGRELIFTAGSMSTSLRTAPDGTAEVKIDTGSAMPGDYPYSVSFAGNEFYADCSLNSTYSVERIPTEMALMTDWSSGVLSMNVTLSPPVEGDLSFYYYNSDVGGWIFLASGRTDADGKAVVRAEFDKPQGNYRIRAEFRGDSTHAPAEAVSMVRTK